MIASMLLVSLLSVINPEQVEIPEHPHRIAFAFTRIPDTCNWTFRVRVNGGEWEPEKLFPAAITCDPLDQVIKDLERSKYD